MGGCSGRGGADAIEGGGRVLKSLTNDPALSI